MTVVCVCFGFSFFGGSKVPQKYWETSVPIAKASMELTFALHELLRLQINELKHSGKTIRGSVQYETSSRNLIVQFAHIVPIAAYRPIPKQADASELKKVHVFENAIFPFGSPWKSVLRPDVWCNKQTVVNRNG